ncbi:hypothetical protein D918_07981 [Trichuris suis]|nr:hypothetical protein D918_07981 [Trichuris suis]
MIHLYLSISLCVALYLRLLSLSLRLFHLPKLARNMASQPPYNPYYVPGQPQQGNIGWQQPPPPGVPYGYGQGSYPFQPPPPPRPNMGGQYMGGYGASQPTGDDPENPKYGYGFSEASIRQGFIRKVFLILSGQLLVVTAMVALFTYQAVFMATYIAIGCCTNVRRRYPGNVICLAFLTLSLGYIAATTASFYNTESVVIAALICFLACLGVSMFAMQTKYDFTGCMGIMCVVGLVLFLFGIMCAIFTIFMKTPILMIVYAGFGALVFLIYLAIDIQLVIGGKRLELSPEDYVFAAAQLLVDIVYIFMYLLQIIGFARECYMDLLNDVFPYVVRLEDLLPELPNSRCDEKAKEFLRSTIACGRQPPELLLSKVTSNCNKSYDDVVKSVRVSFGWRSWPHELLAKEFVKVDVWPLFLQLVGETCFYLIVTEYSLFRLWPNNVLVQLSGKPFHMLATGSGNCRFPPNRRRAAVIPRLVNRRCDNVTSKRRRRRRRKRKTAAQQAPSKLNVFQWRELKSVRFSARRFTYACNYSERFNARRSPFLNAHSNVACMENLLFNIFGFDLCQQAVGPIVDGLEMLKTSLKHLTRNVRRCYVRGWLDRFCPLPPNLSEVNANELVDKYEKSENVSLLLKSLLNRLVPDSLIGAANKLKLISRFVWCTVRLGRRDWLCLRQFTVGQKTSQCPWLRRCNFASGVEQKLLECVVSWLVNLFILTVRICFYVTEGQKGGICDSTLRFYRKSVWHKLSRDAFTEFRQKCHLRSIGKRLCRTWSRMSRYCTVATLRPLPKVNGCRPIVTSINAKKNVVATVNWSLQPILAIMRFIMSQRPHLRGSLVNGMKEVEERWVQFVKFWRHNKRRSYMFFVRTDMDSCFDHINREKLITLLREKFFQDAPDALTVRRVYFVRRTCSSAVKYKSQHWATTDSSDTFYLNWLERKANAVVEISDANHWTKARAMEALFTCINRFVVKRRGKCYHVADGIPQGLVISSFLCNFYLSCMELDALSFINREEDFFVRSVDDYFMVSCDGRRVVQFYSVLTAGWKGYCLKMNQRKTATNFDGSIEAATWSGVEFNTKTLEVRSCCENAMPAIAYYANPKYFALCKMIACLRWRSKSMCFNSLLNSGETILYNAQQTFSAAASILRYLSIRFGWRRFPITVQYVAMVVRLVLRIFFEAVDFDNLPVLLREQISSSCKAAFAPFYAIARKHCSKPNKRAIHMATTNR